MNSQKIRSLYGLDSAYSATNMASHFLYTMKKEAKPEDKVWSKNLSVLVPSYNDKMSLDIEKDFKATMKKVAEVLSRKGYSVSYSTYTPASSYIQIKRLDGGPVSSLGKVKEISVKYSFKVNAMNETAARKIVKEKLTKAGLIGNNEISATEI